MGLPAYIKISEDIREKIEKGTLKKGRRLLPEEKLARKYGVSRPTLKKALSILVEEGYLYQVPGKGTFVTSPEEGVSSLIRSYRIRKFSRGIGILVPCVTHSLYPGIIRGVEDALRERGYHLILGNFDENTEKEREYMESFLSQGVAGLIISPSYRSHLNPYYRKLKKDRIPLVFTDIPVKGVEADLVATDNFYGAYQGTRFLISLGIKRIAFLIGHIFTYSSRRRFLGFKEALEEEGIPLRKELIRSGEFTQDFGYKSSQEIIKEYQPEAIFSGNEPVTLGVLRAVKEAKLKVPEDVVIMSFDEVNVSYGINLPLIMIRQPRYEIGRVAGELLLERLKKGGEGGPPREILLKPTLKVSEEIIRMAGKEVRKR